MGLVLNHPGQVLVLYPHRTGAWFWNLILAHLGRWDLSLLIQDRCWSWGPGFYPLFGGQVLVLDLVFVHLGQVLVVGPILTHLRQVLFLDLVLFPPLTGPGPGSGHCPWSLPTLTYDSIFSHNVQIYNYTIQYTYTWRENKQITPSHKCDLHLHQNIVSTLYIVNIYVVLYVFRLVQMFIFL